MKMKNLLLIGAVALVVLGCVIAAGCTSTTTDTDKELALPVGEWICTNFDSSEGKTVTAIQTIKADGTGYWMELNDSNPGFQLTRIHVSTFGNPDQNGAFEKASSTGKTHKMVYDAAKGTLTQDGTNVYTKIDPIVGIWSGIAPEMLGSGKATTIIKPDGTGLSDISYDNGTVRVAKLTWTKNTDGTYAIVFSDGAKQIFTVASDGKTLKTADGRTKTKEFLDTSFLMSMLGAWYNKDNERLMVFNGDGTGSGLIKNGIVTFTWEMTDIGKFTVTCIDGTADDGTSLKGKKFEWAYDRDNDVFSTAGDTKYIHPMVSVDGKFILA